jgi:signal transduction histidine kinase
VKKYWLSSKQAHREDLSNQDLSNQAPHEAMQTVLDTMEVGLERVSHLVQNMSITESASSSKKQSCNINHHIQATCKKLEKQFPQRIKLDLVLAKLPRVYIDTYKINQLLTSLLTNACEAITGDGVITVYSKAHLGQIEISVADTGCGIQKEMQELIFDPCFSSHKGFDSTGLGLAMSRDIAKEHGGDLSVNSVSGEGAMFTVSLPFSEIVIH